MSTTFSNAIFSGKRALVSGGTQGIGGAIARQLAALGASVLAVGLPPFAEAEFSGSGVTLATLDVTSSHGVAGFVEDLGALDILVNCAGVIRRGAEHDIDVFESVINVNLNGSMRLCKATRPLLKESGGCIVNLASMLSFFGGGLVPAYSASKGGIMQLTKSLAIAYAVDGIRVNAVAPGWITTPLTQPLQDDLTRSRSILSRTPLGRWGQPEDVAGAVAFLCSPAAAFITGVILPVDGGYLVA